MASAALHRERAKASDCPGLLSRWKASRRAVFSPTPGSFFNSPKSPAKEPENCIIKTREHKTFFYFRATEKFQAA
jgi:hypothetical protein